MPGDEHEFLPGNAQRRQHLFHLGENRVIAAARAPADFLIAGEILGSQNRNEVSTDIGLT